MPTRYADVNVLLDLLSAQIHAILGDTLIGLYLYGSVVMGGYDARISDVDLLAAISSDLDAREFQALKGMVDAIKEQYPQWDERIEIAFLSLHGLRTFKTHTSPLAKVSPGEPLHIFEAGAAYLMNWYQVRERGVTLFGVPPETIIEPVTKDEFREAVIAHVQGWREWVEATTYPGSQSYAILTLCRGLYTVTHGEHTSKVDAAAWAAAQFPAWAWLIERALAWRLAPQVGAGDPVETRRFVNFMIDQVNRRLDEVESD